MPRQSLRGLLDHAAAPRVDAVAILAPGLTPMTFGELVAQLDRVAVALDGRIGPDDRVAIVAPDGARTAVAMLATIACAALAPLDPRLTRDELARQLARLKATLVIVDDASPDSARLAAADANVPVATIRPDDDASIAFSLVGLDALPRRPVATTHLVETTAPRGGADVALVVCTSGTTGKPKLVPLTHDNVLTMMLANVDVLGLTPADRCLSVMPLCHIHGLGAVLNALLSGGCVAILPGFGVDAFYASLTAFAPTWYTAVPTIHQVIVEHAPRHAELLAGLRERRQIKLVRSGSAPMPSGVPGRLEAAFGAPYVEASGATEASAYLCSNRPATRRIGSVGLPMPGTTLRIVDERGLTVAPGATGELVARGPGIFAGYADDEATTRDAFTTAGEFRTGDLARCDADGFYFLSGRLKEQVNRGGMKVSPAEVEAALLAHAAVAQAAVFGIADARLGQEVGACVVLRADATCTPIELQRHCARHVAEYKVPRHVVIVDEIPVGARGKVERMKLAEQLGGATRFDRIGRGYALPTSPVEQAIAAIWSDVLGADVTDVGAPFFAIGGDSVQALRVCLAIERRFGRPMPLAAIGACPTIGALAAMLDGDGWQAEPGAPIILRDGEVGGPTLFVLPGVGGNIFNYHPIARRLPAGVRVVGLPLPGADGLEPPPTSMAQIVEGYARRARALAGDEPIAMAGYSFGGRVAFEVARRLLAGGSPVAFVGLIDVRGPKWPPPKGLGGRLAGRFRGMRAVGSGSAFCSAWPMRRAPATSSGSGTANRRGAAKSNAAVVDEIVAPSALPNDVRERARAMAAACQRISDAWRPMPLAGVNVRLYRATVPTWVKCDLSDHAMGWAALVDGLEIVDVPGSHVTMLHEPHVAALANALGETISYATR